MKWSSRYRYAILQLVAETPFYLALVVMGALCLQWDPHFLSFDLWIILSLMCATVALQEVVRWMKSRGR